MRTIGYNIRGEDGERFTHRVDMILEEDDDFDNLTDYIQAYEKTPTMGLETGKGLKDSGHVTVTFGNAEESEAFAEYMGQYGAVTPTKTPEKKAKKKSGKKKGKKKTSK